MRVNRMTDEDVEKYEAKGWRYSLEHDAWISPTGRLADTPGMPFRGQLSKLELAILKKKNEPRERDIRAIHLVPRYDTGRMYPVYEYRIEYTD